MVDYEIVVYAPAGFTEISAIDSDNQIKLCPQVQAGYKSWLSSDSAPPPSDISFEFPSENSVSPHTENAFPLPHHYCCFSSIYVCQCMSEALRRLQRS